jgi:hypothetical protein
MPSLQNHNPPRQENLRLQPSASQTLPQRRTTSIKEHAISTTPPTCGLQPSAGLEFKNKREHQYFAVFQESAAAQLLGYCDSSLWDRDILRACHEKQWVVMLVVVIGALHQSLNTPPTHEAESRSHYSFAIQQYRLALGELRTDFEQEHRTESRVRLVLISSLLLTCCETYTGTRDQALTQAETGIGVLLEWSRQEEPTDDLVDDWSHIRHVASRFPNLEDELLRALQRLDYQILLYRGFQPNRHVPQFPTIAHQFTSINEAYNFWDLVMRRVLYFHAINNITEQHSASGYEDDNTQASAKAMVYPSHIRVESDKFKATTEQFLRHFNPIFQRSRQEPGTKDYLLANLVMIRVLSRRAVLSQRPSKSELYSDYFLLDYQKVIQLARELINDPKTTLKKAIFGFDIILSISIFSLSRLCREPEIRRQAINLLHRGPQRKGWFNSLVFAKASEWLMHWEEERMVNGFIPDTARLRLIKHELGPHERTAMLYCSQLVQKDGNTARELFGPVMIIL